MHIHYSKNDMIKADRFLHLLSGLKSALKDMGVGRLSLIDDTSKLIAGKKRHKKRTKASKKYVSTPSFVSRN